VYDADFDQKAKWSSSQASQASNMDLTVPLNDFLDLRKSRGATLESACLPLPQMWAPGNTVDCPAPQQPGRTCDSPSGYRPRTGAPLHHPVKTKLTSVCASVGAAM